MPLAASTPPTRTRIGALIRQVIDDPGVLVPLVAAEELRESADNGDPKRELLQRLETHVSSAVYAAVHEAIKAACEEIG